MTTDFLGPFADDFGLFVSHKRALGRRYNNEVAVLCQFGCYLAQQSILDRKEVTPDVIEAFLVSRHRTNPKSHNQLLGVLVRCFKWLVVQGLLEFSPVHSRPRRAIQQRIPFIFDQIQARQLLQIASELPESHRAKLRGSSYRMIFALLYGLGLRVGEVVRLCINDIDFTRNLLIIKHTKFSKSRLVPFGPRMGQNLRDYLYKRMQLMGESLPNSPLFSFTKDHNVSIGTIRVVFHSLITNLGLVNPVGVTPPRPRDLRRSFAVGTLRRWYRSGINPSQRLYHLSTFLGHVELESTAVYLTITEDLLQEASNRFALFSASTLKELKS